MSAGQELPDGEDDLTVLVNTKIDVASKSAERAGNAAGIISVITKEELQRYGARTLADVLNRVPGVVLVSNYFTNRTLLGFPGDSLQNLKNNVHVLVLVDGRPIREVQEGGVRTELYEAFPVAVIDHIEVIKGPGSVLYGSEAFAGVINVVTQKPILSGLDIKGGTGTEGAFAHHIKADLVRGAFSLVLAGQRTRESDWVVPFGFSAFPLGPTVATQPVNLRTQGTGLFLSSRLQAWTLTGAHHRYHTPYIIPDYQLVGDEHFRSTFLDVGYAEAFSQRWRVAANVSFTQSGLTSYAPTRIGIDRDAKELLAECTSFHALSDEVNLLVGGLYSRAEGTERNTYTPQQVFTDGERPGWAVYAQGEWQMAPSVKGIGGFQVLKVGEGATTWVPRAGLLWRPGGGVHVKFLYGEAFRAPYINENYIQFPGFIVGNQRLNPERVKTTQVGITWVGRRGEATFHMFQTRQSDLITFQYLSGSSGLLSYRNIGSARIHGAELEGKGYLTRSWLVLGSVMLQRTPAGELTGWSDLGAKVGISVRGTWGGASLFNVHQGPVNRALYNPNSGNPKPGRYDLLSFFGTLDLVALTGSTSTRRIELWVQGDNLLGKSHWVPAIGDLWPSELPVMKGARVLLGLRALF